MALLQAAVDFVVTLGQVISASIALRIASSQHLKQRSATRVQFLVSVFFVLPLFLVILGMIIYVFVWLIIFLLQKLGYA